MPQSYNHPTLNDPAYNKWFDTPLTPAERAGYESWEKTNVPQPLDPRYDTQGYYKNVVEKGQNKTAINPVDHLVHFPDTYKKPSYPTFSTDSQYASGPFKQIAGRWNGEQFIPPGVPTAEQESLGRPLDSLIGHIIQGAGGVMLGGETPGALNTAQQMIFGKALDMLGGQPKAPEMQEMLQGGMVPDWYAQRRGAIKYKVPDTAPLMREKGFGDTSGLNKEEQKYYPGEGYPEYHSKLPPLIPVGESPPRPEDLIYHGLSSDLQGSPDVATGSALRKLPQIQESGLRSGWFSEQPHDPFGPLYVGASPNDVWPQYPRRNKMQIDPSVELTPYKHAGVVGTKGAINPETTTSPMDVVPPEKLWLIDHRGNLLGRLAPGQNEPGYEQWKGSASEYWKNQAKPLQEGEEGVGPFTEDDPNTIFDEHGNPMGTKKLGQAMLPFDEQGKMIPWHEENIAKDLMSEKHSINSIATKWGVGKEMIQDIWKSISKTVPK